MALAVLASAPAWVLLGLGTAGFLIISKALYDAERELYKPNAKNVAVTAVPPMPAPSGAITTITDAYADPLLQAIAKGQCLGDPTPSAKKCDPGNALQWMLSHGWGVEETTSGIEFDFQRYYAGRRYHVPTGTGEEIFADGARWRDCALLETKFVNKPDNSPYVIGSKARQSAAKQRFFISKPEDPTASLDASQDDEFRRYGLALRAPDIVNPFVKLEVITNEPRSSSYWQFWINKNNVPNASIRVKPWPVP